MGDGVALSAARRRSSEGRDDVLGIAAVDVDMRWRDNEPFVDEHQHDIDIQHAAAGAVEAVSTMAMTRDER